MQRAATERDGSTRPAAWALALVVATVLAYVPALGAGFIWDDDKYLTENAVLREPGGFARIWVPGETPQYYPAVFASFWLEQRLWGLHPAGYHAVNVLLHALAAVLVWRLASRIRLPGAWLLGALFALHPVHVESVAWITERKNVLSAVFYLLAARAYLRFHDGAVRRGAWYATALVLFVLALLAKTVTCSLPAALILVMLWRRERLSPRVLLPLVPLFLLGLALGLHTAHLERTLVGADGPEFGFAAGERVQIAGRALLFYAGKLLFPWPLAFFYPRWELDAADPRAYWPVALVVLAAGAAIVAWRRGRRGPALALAYFAGTLFPALGFFDVYPMRYSFVADHFQYLASLGVLALVAAGLVGLARRARGWLPLAGGAALVVCAALTWRQATTYADAETLWRATLRVNPDAWMARTNLAQILSDRGENAAALEELELALGARPSARAADQIRFNTALALGKLGRHAEALARFEEVQRSTGGMDVRIAQTLERLGRDDEAEATFRAALDGPQAESALVPLGVHLLRRERPAEALAPLERAVSARPDDVDALMFLADAYAGAGRTRDAIRTAERALAAVRARGDARTDELIRRRLLQLRDS